MIKQYADIGGVWLPERSKSFAGKAVMPQRSGIVVASVRRPLWSVKGVLKLPEIINPKNAVEEVKALLSKYAKELDPRMFTQEVIWASITHNERVDDGAALQFNRVLGTVGASNGVATSVAVANSNLTKTKTDSSLEADAADLTTSEFTTIGLSRATGTVQNYSAPASLNGTASADVVKSFSVSGTGTAEGSGLFDSNTPTGSKLYVEDNFGSAASVVSGDTLQITWTITM